MIKAQDLITPTDTTLVVAGDTVVPAKKDSALVLDSIPRKNGLEAPVSYPGSSADGPPCRVPSLP